MEPGRVARWFEMHLADELGVRPEVDRCVECGRLLEADERYRWLPPLGERSPVSEIVDGTAAHVASWLTLVAAAPIAWLFSTNAETAGAEPVPVSVEADDREAGRGQGPHGGPPDPTGGPGDEDVSGHRVSLRPWPGRGHGPISVGAIDSVR